MSASATLKLTQQLIACRSLTPDDAGCCDLMGTRLAKLGFKLEYLNSNGVTNLWATLGNSAPLLVLAGHTDVVPTGPLDQWHSDPFTPTLRDGVLYGRGAADMKSGLAAMVCAVERFVAKRCPHPATGSAGGPPLSREGERGIGQRPVVAEAFTGTIAFLITSDEEGVARHGTKHVVEILKQRGIKPDYAIVGEASSNQTLGDRIMIGRRGSLGCDLKVLGKQGHVAYPHKADNPVHRLLPALAELTATRWDEGNAHFPPTSVQISNFKAGTGANNVIPGEAEVIFNFRYCTELNADTIKARVTAVLDRHCPRYEANWWHTGEPFLTRHGALIAAAQASILQHTTLTPELFTGGGTSDARFIAPMGTEVIELGPINDSIHKLNEHVKVADLERLSILYEGILERLL